MTFGYIGNSRREVAERRGWQVQSPSPKSEVRGRIGRVANASGFLWQDGGLPHVFEPFVEEGEGFGLHGEVEFVAAVVERSKRLGQHRSYSIPDVRIVSEPLPGPRNSLLP